MLCATGSRIPSVLSESFSDRGRTRKDDMKPSQVAVTDHALLRFLERVRGFDLSKERWEIAEICRGVTNGTVKKHGHRFEVKDGSVITVMPACPIPNRTTRLKHQREK